MVVGFIGGKFLPLHLGHVNAIVEAANQCDELYVVLSHSEKRDSRFCKGSKMKYIPGVRRLSWLRQVTADMENVKVIDVEDSYGDEDYDWSEGAFEIKLRIGKKIDLIFSSEKSYSKIFKELYPESRHVIIDSLREKFPISGTEIRERGVFECWDFLPQVVRRDFVKKVVVVGTESCGKSTLVRNLAKVFNTEYVGEFGRDVCFEVGGAECLRVEDFVRIGYGHKMIEFEKLKLANRVLFVDTEVLITKYYLNLYMEQDSKLFDEMFKFEDYDLWVYLESDVEWVDDGTRLHGSLDVRARNDQKLKKLLDSKGVKYVCVSGSYQERFEKVKRMVCRELE